MADKKFSFGFASGEVMYTSIRKSAGGYNYATVGVKRGKDEYINIDYEWEGDKIPDFVMDMLSFMQTDKDELVKASKEFKEEYAEFSFRLQKCH